jgi:hypothetical protein
MLTTLLGSKDYPARQGYYKHYKFNIAVKKQN